jgi:hypothetical protein
VLFRSFEKTNDAMSTVILEVEEKQREALFELLEKIPGVRVVNQRDATTEVERYPWLALRGKDKYSQLSSASLAATNEENKRLESQ